MIPYENWPSALLFVSVLASLGVEGLKNLCPSIRKEHYNFIALAMSTIISILVWGYHLMQNGGITFDGIGTIEFVFFIFANYVVTTVGYDKVLATFKDAFKGGSV